MKVAERNTLIEEHLIVAEICADKFAREFNLYEGNRYEREDLVQEAMVAMIEATPKYDPTRGVSYKTYIFAAMRNRLLEELFKKKHNAKQVGREAAEDDTSGEYDEMTFEEKDYVEYMSKYAKRKLDRYEGAIPTDTVIQMTAEGKSASQIAEELGVPIKAIYLKKDRIKRKAKTMRDEICEELFR